MAEKFGKWVSDKIWGDEKERKEKNEAMVRGIHQNESAVEQLKANKEKLDEKYNNIKVDENGKERGRKAVIETDENGNQFFHIVKKKEGSFGSGVDEKFQLTTNGGLNFNNERSIKLMKDALKRAGYTNEEITDMFTNLEAFKKQEAKIKQRNNDTPPQPTKTQENTTIVQNASNTPPTPPTRGNTSNKPEENASIQQPQNTLPGDDKATEELTDTIKARYRRVKFTFRGYFCHFD